ncbi:hypothetical protein LTR53_007290 [Teratosphaeriaceae sp. CCFEE 6253]|nr:hypothetical protein LTR53_007290 [Teratosphaeriaceae sp. CCFEE 6253]
MRQRECTTCARDLPLAQFPKHPTDSKCTHERETCRRYWREWLGTQVKSKGSASIACVQCPNTLDESEIRALATPRIYQLYPTPLALSHSPDTYLDASLKATISALPEFRWCTAPTCPFGQLHDEGDISRCAACAHKACVTCNTAWHAEETCAAYQARTAARAQDEESSAQAIERMAKLCPGCGRKLEKIGGCDHMTCKVCRHEFCWICLAAYQAILRHGNHMHKSHCQHHRAIHSTGPLNDFGVEDDLDEHIFD